MRNYDYLIAGYYGMQNTGDDALLASVCTGIARQQPDANIAITATRSEYGAAVLPDSQRFRGHNRFALYRAAARSTSIVFGGGSTLHTRRDIELKNHMLSCAKGGPHSALGIGLGPFADLRTFEACRKLLNKLSFVGVRDMESLYICDAMDLQTPYELTFDLAPAYLGSVAPMSTQLERSGIGVSLCPVESIQNKDTANENIRIHSLARVLSETARITGETVVLFDFNGHEQLGDADLNSRLQMALDREVSVKRIPYSTNPLHHLDQIARLKCIVGMRLHAQIYAFMAGTPVVALNYHSKNAGWAEQIGMPAQYQFDCQSFDHNQLFLTLVRGLSRGFSENLLPVNQAIELSKRNWRFSYA